MDFTAFIDSLSYMWRGMLGIFCVTAVIIASIALLNRFCKEREGQ